MHDVNSDPITRANMIPLIITYMRLLINLIYRI